MSELIQQLLSTTGPSWLSVWTQFLFNVEAVQPIGQLSTENPQEPHRSPGTVSQRACLGTASRKAQAMTADKRAMTANKGKAARGERHMMASPFPMEGEIDWVSLHTQSFFHDTFPHRKKGCPTEAPSWQWQPRQWGDPTEAPQQWAWCQERGGPGEAPHQWEWCQERGGPTVAPQEAMKPEWGRPQEHLRRLSYILMASPPPTPPQPHHHLEQGSFKCAGTRQGMATSRGNATLFKKRNTSIDLEAVRPPSTKFCNSAIQSISRPKPQWQNLPMGKLPKLQKMEPLEMAPPSGNLLMDMNATEEKLGNTPLHQRLQKSLAW